MRSVLLAGDSTARVLISIVPAMSDPFNPFGQPNWIPIRDASVRLVAGPDTIPLISQAGAATNPCMEGPVHENSPAGDLLPGCYVGAVSGGIQPGLSYGLIADLPGHGRIVGQTTVPQSTYVLEPAAGAEFRVWGDDPAPPPPVTVEWSAVGPGILMQLDVRSLDEQCNVHITTGAIGLMPEIGVRNATSADLLVRLHCAGASQDSAPGYLTLTAFDSAYARYQEATRKNHRILDASAGFTGPAIGVFGSAAMARHPVQFIAY